MYRASIAVCCVFVLGLVATAQLSTSRAPKKDAERDKVVQVKQGELDDLRIQAAAWREVAVEELSKGAPRNVRTGELYNKDLFESQLRQRYADAVERLKADSEK